MWQLIAAVSVATLISFFCSLSEAALYSISRSSIEKLRKDGKRSGDILFRLRADIEKPITAILTLNTISHTAGASIAGAAAAEVFGAEQLALFAVAFTLVILIFSEIIPKTLGVVYCDSVASGLARTLDVLTTTFLPAVYVLGRMTRWMKGAEQPEATEEDIRAMVSLTRRSGLLKPFEEMTIKNILELDTKTVEEIMTPRTVVFSLPSDVTVSEARESNSVWPNSRIPVYEGDDPEDIIGIVYRRKVLEMLAEDRDDMTLKEIMKPAEFVLETMTLDRVLMKLVGSKMHLLVVLDEFGGISGVVTLEDVFEEILGKEIVDETDIAEDMRELARQKRLELIKKREEGE